MATILMIFSRINLTNFVQTQKTQQNLYRSKTSWPRNKSTNECVCNRYSISVSTPLKNLLRLNEIQVCFSLFSLLEMPPPAQCGPGRMPPGPSSRCHCVRISETLANVASRLNIASPSLRMTNCHWKGRGHGHVTFLIFGK